MTIRRAAVAGQFYEGDPIRLQRDVRELLAGGRAPDDLEPRALIVPHAGYMYSGGIAAAAYRCLEGIADRVRNVALFGPAHRVYVEGMAIPPVEAFATPLGNVPLNRSLLEQLAALPGVLVSEEAHREEHSLEVQLPFLQTVLGEFSLVPVVVGRCPPAAVARAMETLWREPGTLLVVSTDLSHFHDYDEAREIDATTCERLLARARDLDGQDACGAAVLNGLMSTALGRSLEIDLLDRCNSGDTSGHRDRVVGYGAFVLH